MCSTTLRDLGATMGGPWTKDVPLYGGGELARRASLPCRRKARRRLSRETCHRWAFAYGDQIERSMRKVLLDPKLAREIAPGVPLAELIHAVEVEDAMTAEDFLLRRTKLHLTLDQRGRDAVAAGSHRQVTPVSCIYNLVEL